LVRLSLPVFPRVHCVSLSAALLTRPQAMGGSVLGLYTPLRLTPARIPLVSAHIPLRFKAGSNERRVELANLCTGTALQGMPNSLRVAPGPPGDRSLVSGIGLSLASIGRLATLTVYARDRFGNNVSAQSSLPHQWFFYSNATKHAAAVDCLRNLSNTPWCTSGQYSTSALILASGAWATDDLSNDSRYAISYKATISGHYSHLVQAFAPGGLQAHYFAGLSYVGPGIRSRIDPQVSFVWARAQDEVTTQVMVPIAIRWTGLLRPQRNESFTLILRSSGGTMSRGASAEGNGSARVWLQGRLVLSLPGAPEEQHARVDVLGNQLVCSPFSVSVLRSWLKRRL